MGMRLENKVAVVTGGGGGIGRVICRTLAMEGARVGVVDIDLEKARSVADEIEMAGGMRSCENGRRANKCKMCAFGSHRMLFTLAHNRTIILFRR